MNETAKTEGHTCTETIKKGLDRHIIKDTGKQKQELEGGSTRRRRRKERKTGESQG